MGERRLARRVHIVENNERNKMTEVLLRSRGKMGYAARNVQYQVYFLGIVKPGKIPVPRTGILGLPALRLVCDFLDAVQGFQG